MKCLAIFSLLLSVHVALSTPVPKDQYVDSDPRWSMVPDESGKLHLIDLGTYEEQIAPHFVPQNDMFFVLHTRLNPTFGQRIDFTLASLEASNYNPSHPTKFSIHGWLSDSTTPTNLLLRQAFHSVGDFNIITVDWGVGARNTNYEISRGFVPLAGAFVASYVDFLQLNGYLRFNDLQLIGISLGGQMVGLVGKYVQRGRVGVIMSLDPAGPSFHYDRPNERVDSTDGEYVEVIYTNAGDLGFDRPVGHANFWPNFGRTQPGCVTGDLSGTCSHTRSVFLHAESVRSVFTGHECASFEEIQRNECTRTGRTGRMGGPVGSIGLRGNFYLTTNGASPFSQG